ncbi:hypothetical protein ACLOJK_025988 [Asimina triloba]
MDGENPSRYVILNISNHFNRVFVLETEQTFNRQGKNVEFGDQRAMKLVAGPYREYEQVCGGTDANTNEDCCQTIFGQINDFFSTDTRHSDKIEGEHEDQDPIVEFLLYVWIKPKK